MALDLSKEEATIRLEKRHEKIRKICLEKEPLVNLTARVAVVVDTSGSMLPSIKSGAVQATLERILPIAMQFDDNGEMEFWTFNEYFKRHAPINLLNFYHYIENNKITAYGGTEYSPVLYDVCKYFMEENPAKLPNYIIFITDGANHDKDETDAIIKLMSKCPIFIQFIGIGGDNYIGTSRASSFDYLSKLDNMRGRYVDNANFFEINSLHDEKDMSDDDLYHKLLAEYPIWLENKKVKDMIINADTISLSKDFEKAFRKKKGIGADTVLEIIDAVIDIITDLFT